MVNARLHIICGKCGCNDMWKWYFCPQDEKLGIDYSDVSICCDNCATIHYISDNAEHQKDKILNYVSEEKYTKVSKLLEGVMKGDDKAVSDAVNFLNNN